MNRLLNSPDSAAAVVVIGNEKLLVGEYLDNKRNYAAAILLKDKDVFLYL